MTSGHLIDTIQISPKNTIGTFVIKTIQPKFHYGRDQEFFFQSSRCSIQISARKGGLDYHALLLKQLTP